MHAKSTLQTTRKLGSSTCWYRLVPLTNGSARAYGFREMTRPKREGEAGTTLTQSQMVERTERPKAKRSQGVSSCRHIYSRALLAEVKKPADFQLRLWTIVSRDGAELDRGDGRRPLPAPSARTHPPSIRSDVPGLVNPARQWPCRSRDCLQQPAADALRVDISLERGTGRE